MKKVSILGETWTIQEASEENNKILQSCDGYCDWTMKEIFIGEIKQDETTVKDIWTYKAKVLRHEIIHAFLFESGCTEMAKDEKMIDWFAMNWNKIEKVFAEV